MDHPCVERRSGPRVIVGEAGVKSDRMIALTVRLLDIASTGVLLASPQPLEVGQHARLSTRLGDHPIEAELVVRRVANGSSGRGRYKVGARFISLDENTRQMMQQFLANGGNR